MNRFAAAALIPLIMMGCTVSGGGDAGNPDSTEMATIQGGTFTVGSDAESSFDAPIRQVVIPTFKIDKFEVTNSQFRACVAAGACPELNVQGMDQIPGYYGDAAYDDAPVAYVTWYQAGAYCRYAGKRLPTELEFEAAARGQEGRLYPWGDDSPTCDFAQYGECNQIREAGTGPMKVGSLTAGATPEGVFDLAGNMAEWTADWYDDDLYYSFEDGQAPIRAEVGKSKVIRGGSWYCEPERMLASRREAFPPIYRAGNVGFRCASSN